MRKTDKSLGEAPARRSWSDPTPRDKPFSQAPHMVRLGELLRPDKPPCREAIELLRRHKIPVPGKGLVFRHWVSDQPRWRLPPGEAAKTQAEAQVNRQAARAAGHPRFRGLPCERHPEWQGERLTGNGNGGAWCYGCAQERRNKSTRKGGPRYERNLKLQHAKVRRNQQTAGHPTQVAHALRKLVRNFLFRSGLPKDRSTEAYLGCSFEDATMFLKLQCEALGFDWGERRRKGKEWDIDHVRPVSAYTQESDDPELASRWWNLQILSRPENAAKGDRLDWQPSALHRRKFERAARWMLKRGYAPPPDGTNVFWPIGGTDGREPCI